MRFPRVAVLAILVGAGAPEVTAVAQPVRGDDWGVKRDPFDRRVVERWRAVAEKNPDDAAAVKKLWSLYARHSSTDKLIAEAAARAEKNPDKPKLALLLGHLYRLRPDADKALEAYETAARLAPDDPSPQLARGELLRQKGR
jgi:Flp pilus assembly protein TadD